MTLEFKAIKETEDNLCFVNPYNDEYLADFDTYDEAFEDMVDSVNFDIENTITTKG